jgi:hypothetical protein
MKHARPDYDRIQDPAGLIPADEPVFLLRGQDRAAPIVLEIWTAIVDAWGGDWEITERAKAHAHDMRVWQHKHGKKIPDL